jgi:hypothetical protein
MYSLSDFSTNYPYRQHTSDHSRSLHYDHSYGLRPSSSTHHTINDSEQSSMPFNTLQTIQRKISREKLAAGRHTINEKRNESIFDCAMYTSAATFDHWIVSFLV